jgi:hypothetical protein
VLAPVPSATIWKASKHLLVGDPMFPERIEVASDATWTKVDPFQSYRPTTRHRGFESDPSPHVPFLKLADMVRAWYRPKRSQRHAARSKENTILLHDSALLCANLYGLLGLFDETFAAPVLPPHVSRYALLAPDAVIDGDGRMHAIDPATEGKARLVRALDLHDPRTGHKGGFRPDELVLPHDLHFPSVSFTPFGLLPSAFESLSQEMFSWAEVKNLYGVCALLDEEVGMPFVSIIYTCEPLEFWYQELRAFRSLPNPPEYYNRKLADVRLQAVRDDDGRTARSYNCSSLLKALYLMLLLDEDAGVRMQRCQASGCAEYVRVGPLERGGMYCRPPLGKEQSKCASRASSAMYRERQRKRRKSDTT